MNLTKSLSVIFIISVITTLIYLTIASFLLGDLINTECEENANKYGFKIEDSFILNNVLFNNDTRMNCNTFNTQVEFIEKQKRERK